MLTDSCQQHELEGESGEVVMEEENPREKEVGKIVHGPAHQEDTTTSPKMRELSWKRKENVLKWRKGGREREREDSPWLKSYTCLLLLIK